MKKLRASIILLVCVFAVLIAFIYQNSKKGTDPTFVLPDFTSTKQKECALGPEIEYFYYEDTDFLKNNKFGLYIYAENKSFFEIAQKLVNSNGGEWGYVLIPYNVKDRDKEKWGRVFDQLRNKQLIPIIQLWDIDTEKYEDQTDDAAEFLDSFMWPIKNRYISAYNEMNDAKFWYGRIDPKEYSMILNYTIDTFKKQNSDFFIMNGAFNVSASNTSTQQDAFEYMLRMNEYAPGIFERLDGWASHPYPQPNFSGSPSSYGRWSIRAYENELEFLKSSLGVKKELPVFITETGWAHAEGENYNPYFLSAADVADNMVEAYEKVWLKDSRVRAVIPFTIRYDAPFDHFSWVNKDNVPYIQYEAVKKMKKEAGNPPALKVGKIGSDECK